MENTEFGLLVVSVVHLFKLAKEKNPKKLLLPILAIVTGGVLGGVMYWGDAYLAQGILDGALVGLLATGSVGTAFEIVKKLNLPKEIKNVK